MIRPGLVRPGLCSPKVLGPAYDRAAATDGFASFVGELLRWLPRPFAQSPSILKFLLAPLGSSEKECSALVSAAGLHIAESSALHCGKGPAVAEALARRASKRLQGAVDATQARVLPRAAAAPLAAAPVAGQRAAVARAAPAPALGVIDVDGEPAGQARESGAPSSTEAPLATRPSTSQIPAEALVVSIRLDEFGFDGEAMSGGALQVKQNARLARALKRLAGELYGSDIHWQLELLQNADDNAYDEEIEPTAEFRMRSEAGEVVFRCNEQGFGEGDIRAHIVIRGGRVLWTDTLASSCSTGNCLSPSFLLQVMLCILGAICDIGNSSKVGSAKYAAGGRVVATGEKGLYICMCVYVCVCICISLSLSIYIYV